MNTFLDPVLWAVRMLMLMAGTWLTSRGYGDEAFWNEAIGLTLAMFALVWSRISRNRALASVPGETPATVADAMIERIRGMIPK